MKLLFTMIFLYRKGAGRRGRGGGRGGKERREAEIIARSAWLTVKEITRTMRPATLRFGLWTHTTNNPTRIGDRHARELSVVSNAHFVVRATRAFTGERGRERETDTHRERDIVKLCLVKSVHPQNGLIYRRRCCHFCVCCVNRRTQL